MMKQGYYDIAAFNFEQAVQLRLKAILLELTGDVLKTHSIRTLLDAIGEALGRREEVRKFIREHRNDIKALEDTYVETRYEAVVYKDYDAEAIRKSAKLILDFVEEFVRKNGEHSKVANQEDEKEVSDDKELPQVSSSDKGGM
ncbi:HEPN domain-containing protein [Pyrococcus kukulkanii]